MSVSLGNRIPVQQRFTQKDGVEFHVFSTETEDAAAVEQWIAVSRPTKVLLDAETVARLKNRRIEWEFDDEKTIAAVTVKGEA